MACAFSWCLDDAVREGKITKEEVKNLKAWTDDQRNFPKFTDEQLCCFLTACDRNEDLAKTTIKEYLSAKNGSQGIFADRDVEKPEIKRELESVDCCLLPTRTDDGCAIITHRLSNTSFRNINLEVQMKMAFMNMDLALYQELPTGLIFLYDMKGSSIMHIMRLKVSVMRTYLHYLQYGLPIKLIKLYILNTPYFINKAMAIFRPFLTSALLSKVMFLTADLDMEEFYKTAIPKKHLPADYGGDLPSLKVIQERNIKLLKEIQFFFDCEEEQRSSALKIIH